MGADLRALLQNADADVVALLLRELTQPDRRGQARGAGADDDHVVFHVLAFHHDLPHCGSRMNRQQLTRTKGNALKS